MKNINKFFHQHGNSVSKLFVKFIWTIYLHNYYQCERENAISDQRLETFFFR